MKCNRTCVLLLGVSAWMRILAVQPEVASNETAAAFLGERVTISSAGADFSEDFGKSSRQVRRDRVLKAHAPEDVFLKMGDETLTWGCMEDYASLILKVSPLSLPPQATVEQVEQIIATSKLKLIEIAGNQFVQNWAIVPKARAAGLDVTESEVLVALTNSVRKLYKKNKNLVLPAILRPDSYFYRNQVGYLISKKYFDTVIPGKVSVSDEDVAVAVSNQVAEIAAAKEYNATLRPKIEGVLASLKTGEREFEEAAFEFSDCDSSTDDGVLGVFDRDDNKLLPELRDFIFAASTNEMSDVIETPYSFHIVKILKREYGPLEDEDDEDEEGEEARE